MEEKTWTKRFTSLISKNDKRRECQQETHQIHQVYQTGIRPTVPLVVGPVTAVRLPRTSLPKIWAENCNTCSPAMSYWHLNISCTLRTQVLVFPVNGLLFVCLCFLSFLLVSSLPHSRMAPTLSSLLLKATQSIDELFLLPGDLGKSWYGDRIHSHKKTWLQKMEEWINIINRQSQCKTIVAIFNTKTHRFLMFVS